MTSMFLTACAGIMLVGALSLVSSQDRSIRRSQTWNLQIPAVEAGIEEAMTHLNNNVYVGDLTPGARVSKWCDVDGWYASDYAHYSKKNTLPDGSYYIVTIDGTDPNSPRIFSEGHAASGLSMNRIPMMFATVGSDGATVKQPVRTVQVDVANAGLFANGLAAREYIDMNGNRIITDSFDSSNPAYSTGGQYDPNKRRSHGDVATANGILNAVWVNVGNANIMGHITTAPNGTVSLGPQGIVGDQDWQSANSGAQPGSITHDLNVSFPDVKTPDDGGWLIPSSGVITNVQVVNTVVTNISPGYPLGHDPIVTNFVTIKGSTPPGSGLAFGAITTNATKTTTTSLPTRGTYLGSVITNTTTVTGSSYPAAGTYVGTPVQVTSGKNGKGSTKWQYQTVTGYTYNLISGYTWAQITNYSYFTVTTVTNGFVATAYTNILDNGAYKMANVSGTTYVRGNARLWVTDTLNLSGITIGPGASLKLYSGAADVSLGGNGVVNQPGNCTNFFFFGLPNCTSVSLSGNACFIGCIYAPNASLKLNGGGNDQTDFIGAGVFKNATLNGHFSFHYDESLRKYGPRTGYVIKSWQEVPNARN